MITIFITAAISFFCGAAAVILFIWWFLGFLERKEEKAIYENALNKKLEAENETNTN